MSSFQTMREATGKCSTIRLGTDPRGSGYVSLLLRELPDEVPTFLPEFPNPPSHVSSSKYGRQLCSVKQQQGSHAVDSSVGRAEDCSAVAVILRSLVQIRLDGIFSHFRSRNKVTAESSGTRCPRSDMRRLQWAEILSFSHGTVFDCEWLHDDRFSV